MGSSFAKSERVPIKAVFDDLRFPNEAALIRLYGGPVVRIVRPGHESAPQVAAHASEAFAFEADITVVNDGTVEDLNAKMAALFPVQPLPPKKPRSS